MMVANILMLVCLVLVVSGIILYATIFQKPEK